MSSGGARNSASRNNNRNTARYKSAAQEIADAVEQEPAKFPAASVQTAASTKPERPPPLVLVTGLRGR